MVSSNDIKERGKMLDKTILIEKYKTMRKCYHCKEYLTLEESLDEICYKGKHLFHISCLKKKMLSVKRGRLSESDIDILIGDMVSDSRKKIETIIYKNHLYKYLQEHYDCILLPNYIFTKFESIFLGKFKDMTAPIPPEHFLDMFQRKANWLDKMYHKEKIEGVSRINYDVAVLMNKYGNYLDWISKGKTEQKKIESYTIQNNGVGLTTMIVSGNKRQAEEDIFEEEE